MNNIKTYEYMDDGLKIEFIYSPFFEMICSLHVLTKPEHHLSRLNWAREVKEKMDNRLYEEIIFFGNGYFKWCSIMDFYQCAEEVNDLNVIACLDIISELELIEFVYIIFNKYIDKGEIARSLAERRYLGNDDNLTEGQIQIFRDVEGFRRRLIATLKEYYYLYFEKQLRFIEPLLIRKLKKESAICEDLGIKKYAFKIHPRIEVTEEAFLLHKYTLFTFPFNKLDSVQFLISSFTGPHLIFGLDKKALMFTMMVNLEKAVEEVPFDLFIAMKALGDETRLKILRCIYKKIDSTQAIAKEVNISEAGVSKHLKLMQEAGLLFKKRDGNFIRYVLEREMIDRIPMNIYQYLDG